MRIGIMGGTFDPPHLGHLELARAAREQLELDEVIWIPAARNPQKPGRKTASAKHRMEMVRLMIETEPLMSLSDIEITRGGLSFMVDTLEELRMTRDGDYWLILGMDAFARISLWKQPQRIAQVCRFAVATRPCAEFEVPKEVADLTEGRVDRVELAPTPISSTEIRDMVFEGRSVRRWLSPMVNEYVETHGLYREG